MGYLYQNAINLFHTLSATQSDASNILDGEQSISDAVVAMLDVAEKSVAMIMFPFYTEGKAPMMGSLQTIAQYTVNGSTTAFDLPPDNRNIGIISDQERKDRPD